MNIDRDIIPIMGKTPKDLTGKVFTFLTALRPTAERESGAVVWECQCACGNLTKASARQLREKHRTSCGCRRNAPRERVSANCRKCGVEFKRPGWGPKSQYCEQCRADQHQVALRAADRRTSERRDHIIAEREIIGQCNSCGIRPRLEGRKLCETCTMSRVKSYLKWKYKLTREQVEEQLQKQNNRCAICNELLLQPHIDHHHGNGDFRGILCGTCNQGIGLLKDNPLILQRAAEYIRWNGFKEVDSHDLTCAAA